MTEFKEKPRVLGEVVLTWNIFLDSLMFLSIVWPIMCISNLVLRCKENVREPKFVVN